MSWTEVQIQQDSLSRPEADFYSERSDKWRMHWVLEIRESEFFEDTFVDVIDSVAKWYTHDEVSVILQGNSTNINWYTVEDIWDKTYKISWEGTSVLLTHAPKYSYVRITLDEEYIWIPLNFHTKKRNLNIYNAKDLPSDEARLLLRLRDMWIMKWSLPFLSLDWIEEQLGTANEVESFIHWINNLTEPSELYDDANELLPENTHVVLQKESIIVNEPTEWQALYTFWAGPCNIIAIQDKDTGKIWLAHIDATTSQASITSFFSYFSNPEITLVSWDLWTTRTVIQAMWEDLRDNISYFSLDVTRVDAMWIQVKDGDIRVVYGNNQDINMSIDDDRMNLSVLKTQLQKGLSIDIK